MRFYASTSLQSNHRLLVKSIIVLMHFRSYFFILNDFEREKLRPRHGLEPCTPRFTEGDCAYMAHALSIQPRGTRLRSESRAQLTLS